MVRAKIIPLLVIAFAIPLSSCVPGAQYTLPPDMTVAPGTDGPQQVATYVSSALTQTAVAVLPAAATSASGPTLPADATSTATPGETILADPTLLLY